MPVSVPRLYGSVMASDIAPVAAIPTTAAHFCLWNGEPQGGKTYSITSIGFTCTTSSGAVIIQQLLAHVCPGTQPLINGTAAAKGPFPLDGNGTRDSKAAVQQAVTLTAGQAASGFWHPVGPALITAAMTATIGCGSWVNVAGIYQLAPGSILSLASFCSAAGSAKNTISVTWSEA